MGRARILVVDDEAGTREGLKILLQRDGYEVQTAGDPIGAMRCIKRAPLDCVLMDLNLTPDLQQGIDGMDLIVLLRIHQPQAKAILMSASADPAAARLAKERSVVARFEKPVDLVGLTRLLRSLFPTEGTSADRPPGISRRS